MDRVSLSREELDATISVALGGRAAEEVVFGQISTGAEADIQQMTQIARQMVGRWGMSAAIGPVAVLASDGHGPLLTGASATSEATQQLVDNEVRRIIETANAEVTSLLTEHRDQLDALAHALLRTDTLDAIDAYTAAQLPVRVPDRRDSPELVTW